MRAKTGRTDTPRDAFGQEQISASSMRLERIYSQGDRVLSRRWTGRQTNHALTLLPRRGRLHSSRSGLPESRGQAHLTKELFRLGRTPTLVVDVHAVVVPALRKGPHLIEGHGLTPGHCVPAAPVLDALFRPEEEDRGSGEDDVGVPAGEWHGEVHDGLPPDAGVRHCEGGRLPRIREDGLDAGVGLEQGRDAEGIPGAVCPVSASIDLTRNGVGTPEKGQAIRMVFAPGSRRRACPSWRRP